MIPLMKLLQGKDMGVAIVNDRCVSLLENYDIEVHSTRKGRSAILCETNCGTMILKEYAARREKSVFQDAVLNMICECGFSQVETIVKNKEQELLTTDQDGISYILKTYYDGRECNVRDSRECMLAMETLALLHRSSRVRGELPAVTVPYTVSQEFDKHNKELRRVRKFLKEKGQKTDFEIYLMQCYDYFWELAQRVAGELEKSNIAKALNTPAIVCHGDFQHHNLIVTSTGIHIINFEKCTQDSPARDIYLFMRKLLEKNDWNQEAGFALISAYEKNNELCREDYEQLYYRLSYPEKFWKIVNFYYNSGKAWIPGKNLEKLIKVNEQEVLKKEFLLNFREKYGILSL